jgi:hypothetical protein
MEDSGTLGPFQCVSRDKFNPGHSIQLNRLFATPRKRRDSLWVAKFQFFAWNASVSIADEMPFRGPDGFPYIRLNLPAKNSSEPVSCLSEVCVSLVERGLGAAFFSSAKDQTRTAQYVVTNGVLESLRSYGTWDGDPTDREELRMKPQVYTEDGLETSFIEPERQVLIGDPAPKFLPPHTARLLHSHLSRGWKIEEPRVTLLVDQEIAPSRNLVINKKFSDFPDSQTAAQQTRMLTWYLPPRRGLILMPEDWTHDQMTPLKEFFPSCVA